MMDRRDENPITLRGRSTTETWPLIELRIRSFRSRTGACR